MFDLVEVSRFSNPHPRPFSQREKGGENLNYQIGISDKSHKKLAGTFPNSDDSIVAKAW
jgi:hypothetical protein